MKKPFLLLIIIFLIVPFQTRAETQEIEKLMAQITQLMQLLSSLQLKNSQAQHNKIIPEHLSEGMTHESVKDIQKVLATDKSVYPEALISGYYGPLTTAALKRFQTRQKFAVTGVLDQETRNLLISLIAQQKNGKDISHYVSKGGLGAMTVPGLPDGYSFEKSFNEAKKLINAPRAFAELYYDKNKNSYLGFCESRDFTDFVSISQSKGFYPDCRDDASYYRASMPVSPINSYCIDSTGYSDLVTVSTEGRNGQLCKS